MAAVVNFMLCVFNPSFLKMSSLQLFAELSPFHLLSKCLHPLAMNYIPCLPTFTEELNVSKK